MAGMESIVADHATKMFTLRYHRTFKQMTVAAPDARTSATASRPWTT